MRLLVLFTVVLLTACGFHLRGHAGMPFAALYLSAANPDSLFVADLRRSLEASKVRLVDTADQADVILSIESEVLEKQILTLGSDGRVNEFRLGYRVLLRAYDREQNAWIPAEEIALRRDYSYDDTKALAKEAEENLLYQSMRTDMIQQIVHRLSRSRPQAR